MLDQERLISKLKIFVVSMVFLSPLFLDKAFASTKPIDPKEIISKDQQATFFEKYLGWIEVGKTSRELLELYIGEGYAEKTASGEKVYYIDNKNKRTLIIETNYKGIIEVATYKAFIELPKVIENINQLKISKKTNIKNLMTSMGSRLGYSSVRVMNAYGRPSVEIFGENYKELKYIMLGSYKKDIDFVYLEYSFILKKNKVVEIRIENGK
jgi:hypothetical protein